MGIVDDSLDGGGGLSPQERRVIEDAVSEQLVSPEMAPVLEAGGGEAEGFEQAEAQLVENASDAPLDATQRLLDDAPDAEAEADRAVYADADHEHSPSEEEAP